MLPSLLLKVVALLPLPGSEGVAAGPGVIASTHGVPSLGVVQPPRLQEVRHGAAPPVWQDYFYGLLDVSVIIFTHTTSHQES